MDKSYFEKYPEAEIDLHGMIRDEVLYELEHFLSWAKSEGFEQVRVVTGKGTGSLDKVPVVRNAVMAYLNMKGYHYEFAGMFDGGEGVLYVEF